MEGVGGVEGREDVRAALVGQEDKGMDTARNKNRKALQQALLALTFALSALTLAMSGCAWIKEHGGTIVDDVTGHNDGTTNTGETGGGGEHTDGSTNTGGGETGTTLIDAVEISTVKFNGGDPSGYKLTANLKEVTLTGGSTGAVKVCWKWDVPSWPTRTKSVIGNQWVGYKDSSGTIQMGVWEMIRAEAEVCRTSEAKDGEPPFIQAHGPIGSWNPSSGNEVYFMQSTPTRGVDAAGDVTKERSQIVKVTYP